MIIHIQQYLQRRFHIDSAYFLSAGFWSVLNELRGVIFATAASVLLAYFIPKNFFGLYQYIISVSTIIASFSLTGLATTVTNDSASGKEYKLKKSFRNYFFSLLVGSIIELGIAVYYWQNGNSIIALSFLILAATVPFINASSLFASHLNGVGQFKKIFHYGWITVVVPIVLTIITVLLTRNIVIIIAVSYISKAIANTWALYRVSRQLRAKAAHGSDDSGLLGVHFSITNSIIFMMNKIDSIILFHFLGPVQLASYNVATMLPERVQSFAKTLSYTLIPKMVERNNATIQQKTMRIIVPTVVLLLIGTVLIFFAIPFIYRLLYPAYAESILLAQIYAFSVISTIGLIPLNHLYAKPEGKKIYAVTTTASVIQIGAICIGLYFAGVVGAIIGKTLGKIAVSIFYLATQPR
jgi:O-antigen/teichoic acid export membrane protein